MLATHGGHIEIVKLLLENGANVNGQSEDGTTAVLIAASGYIVILFYFFFYLMRTPWACNASRARLEWGTTFGMIPIPLCAKNILYKLARTSEERFLFD